MDQVKELFSQKLAYTLRVLDSCQTPEQLSAVKLWAEKIFMEAADQVRKNGTTGEKRFASTYKYHVIGQMRQRYIERQAEVNDPGFRTLAREVPLRVGVCRNCNGTGFVQAITCPDCLGSGRVKVRCTVITKVRPFIPEE